MRINEFRVDVFVKFHDSDKITFKLLELSPVGPYNFSLLFDDFCEFVDFSCVKVDSVLEVGSFLSVLSFLGLVLVFLLDSFNQLSEISIFFCDLPDWPLVIKFVPILIVMVLRSDLGIALMERKLTVLQTWEW